MRYFISAMAGCGNLGDDLISKVLVDNILSQDEEAEIGVLSGNEKNGFGYSNPSKVQLYLMPRKNNPFKYFKRINMIKKFIRKSDVFVVGGGGLFQDTHSFFNNHAWIKYRYGKKKLIACGLGIGVGPFKHKNSLNYLKQTLQDFNFIQVRDDHSIKELKQLNLSPVLSSDIIKGNEIYYLDKQTVKGDKKLGCSIRPWKDLSFEKTSELIVRLSKSNGIKEVIFFVFEHSQDSDDERRYALRLLESMEKSSIKARVATYNMDSIDSFLLDFSGVSHAIASRYHANILWQKLKVPTIPISYAPKVRSLYEENDGRAFTASELYSSQDLKNCFQTIPIENDYSLPDFKKYEQKGYSQKSLFLVKIIDFLDFISSSFNSILIRLKHMVG